MKITFEPESNRITSTRNRDRNNDQHQKTMQERIVKIK